MFYGDVEGAGQGRTWLLSLKPQDAVLQRWWCDVVVRPSQRQPLVQLMDLQSLLA